MMNARKPDDIVIVSGLPRSGTSMMMQMIGTGGIPVLTDGQRVADEDNPKGYHEFEAVKKTRQDPSWLEQARGKVVKLVHLLLLDLPDGYDYRIVMMQRDHQQMLASQAVMLRRQGRTGAKLSPEALSRVYAKQMQKVEDAVAARPNFDVLKVNYGEVIANPVAAARQVNTFLGGDLNVDAMAAVVDPSLHRQRS